MGGHALILLDTHIWVWLNVRPREIPSRVAEVIAETDAEVMLSAVSIWEAMLAMQKGRIEAEGAPDQVVRNWLLANPIGVFAVDAEVAILSRTLQFAHGDPADRFIASTAYLHGAALATVDEHLRNLSWLDVLPI